MKFRPFLGVANTSNLKKIYKCSNPRNFRNFLNHIFVFFRIFVFDRLLISKKQPILPIYRIFVFFQTFDRISFFTDYSKFTFLLFFKKNHRIFVFINFVKDLFFRPNFFFKTQRFFQFFGIINEYSFINNRSKTNIRYIGKIGSFLKKIGVAH